jgi:hypothetical protein
MPTCRDCREPIAWGTIRGTRGDKYVPIESSEPEEYHVWDEGTQASTVFGAKRLRLLVHGQILSVVYVPGQRGPLHVTGVEVHQCKGRT